MLLDKKIYVLSYHRAGFYCKGGGGRGAIPPPPPPPKSIITCMLALINDGNFTGQQQIHVHVARNAYMYM